MYLLYICILLIDRYLFALQAYIIKAKNGLGLH